MISSPRRIVPLIVALVACPVLAQAQSASSPSSPSSSAGGGTGGGSVGPGIATTGRAPVAGGSKSGPQSKLQLKEQKKMDHDMNICIGC